MPKEIQPEITRLSRFFQENLNVVRKNNVVKYFDVSPYFPIKREIKKKKVKQKPSGPQFKGFSLDCREYSSLKKNQLEQVVARCEDRLKEVEHFRGFSLEEIRNSNSLCDKANNYSRYFAKRQVFKGFSVQDQTESLYKASSLSAICDSVRTNIYKNIDRRVLTNHMKENSDVVCSKYWWQDVNLPMKTEDISWSDGDSSFPNQRKNGIKSEILQTDLSTLERENEIQKLHNELRQIRKLKHETTEKAKLQKSPFNQIKKELIITQFVPPKSPHHLLEEDLYHDPWSLLVATIFLNKTSARSARPYVFWFLEENPDPLTVVGKKIEQLETYFGALGLQKTRATQVWRMSHDFLYKNWKKVGELYGIGRYGEDAFQMFCLGDFSIKPKDRYLRIYKAWYEMQERKSRLEEMNC